jgi:F-type H+-transporting ATPase subunit gamma
MIKLNWYNQFKNAATQIVQTEQFLPLAVQSDLTTSVGDYILNRPKKRLSWHWFQNRWRHNCIKDQRFSLLNTSNANKATDNATDLRNELIDLQ